MKMQFTLTVDARADVASHVHATVLEFILADQLKSLDVGIAPTVRVRAVRRRKEKK